jgi:ribosomal protein S19E (S16A)
MQALLAEYQSRESQYQEELQQAADQITQISQQNQQYRQLFQALQNAGAIQVTSDGRILISAGASRRSEFGEGENDDFR